MENFLSYLIVQSVANWLYRFDELASQGVFYFRDVICRGQPLTEEEIKSSKEWSDEWFVIRYQNAILKLDGWRTKRLPQITGQFERSML